MSEQEQRPAGASVAVTDVRKLEILGERLTRLAGDWHVEPGPLLKGPGSLGVRLAPPHDDDPRHLDLEFLLNVDRPVETSILNCAMGLSAEPEAAIRQAVDVWSQTTAAVALELVQKRGELATHLDPHGAYGFPGWHAIVGGATGWAVDPDDAERKQTWFAETAPWTALAPVIAPALDRAFLNGVRLFIGQGGGHVSCEVVVNGRRCEPAGEALAAMDWPRTERMSVAHVFLLLVHPADTDGATTG